MKKILILVILFITMAGCTSINSKMRISQDPITGTKTYYGYSWTTGSEDLTKEFNKKTDLSTTMMMDAITKEKKMMFTVVKMKNTGSVVSFVETNEDKLIEKLNGKDAYTVDLNSVEITNGKDSFKVEEPGLTKKDFGGPGTPMGTSTVTFKVNDSDLSQLEKIYNSEKVFLVAIDLYGKRHLGLVSDKTGMLELLEMIKTK